MDILIVLVSVAFIGLITIFVYQYYEEHRNAGTVPKNKVSKKDTQAELLAQSKRRIAEYEEKVKKMEYEFEACRLELSQTKERERTLINEKSQVKFDSEHYEKFKKEFSAAKEELKAKEETVEKEISLRRANSIELTHLKQEHEALKKKLSSTEDLYRKLQSILENLTKDLKAAKDTIREQNKVVTEFTKNKMGGEWVSRAEFEKIEIELKEKDTMIQRFLAIKKEQGENA